MKIAARSLSLLILVSLTTLYMGCKDKDPEKKTEEQTQLEKLLGPWSLVSANTDGDDRTADFQDMVLTLSGNYTEGGTYIYSLTGNRPTPSPWPADGNWMFGTNKSSEMVRDPNTENEIDMTYTVTDSNLTISFTIPDGSAGWPGSGRTKSVTGGWTFTFEKQ